MWNTLKFIVLIVWIVDITNFAHVELLDVTYPVNAAAWLLILFIVGCAEGEY